MILNTPENRKVVTNYLENIDEDTFIEEVVIPLFSSHGYYLYRTNQHGPGEHGKDLIFYKNIPIYYDNEYLVIQAKSEKLTTSNVETFSSQIKRALNIPFPPKSGGANILPHYAIYINSRKHTNDANVELQQMISGKPHIKILSQENVCELIMKTGIGPEILLQNLSTSTPEEQSKEDQIVYNTIMKEGPAEIDNLLNYKLKLIRESISDRTKELIINYIYERWQMDRSWNGTIKPMEWFDTYFDFLTEKQGKYILSICDELLSSTPSYKALPYTRSIVQKITPKLLSSIEEEFVKYCAKAVLSFPNDNMNYLIHKLREYHKSGSIRNSELSIIAEKVVLFEDYKNQGCMEDVKILMSEIQRYVYPEIYKTN